MRFFKNLILIFILISVKAFSQKTIIIRGEAIGKMQKDTVMFVKGILNAKYYSSSEISSEVVDSKFKIKGFFPYPQMYFLSWKSERDKFLFHSERFFFDNSTKEVVIDSLKNVVNGNSALEYIKEFIPFVLNKTDINDIDTYIFENGKEFDFKLERYIENKPSSYVALWFLIERFNENGYSKVYENSLEKFSNKIKLDTLWKIVSREVKMIRIKENEKFPELILKNIDLNSEKILLPKQKIILIDFWFSRCKPCLAQFPRLKNIYEKFVVTNKFDIISISTDKTINVDLWKKRIVENQLKWKNYLDENAVELNNEKIRKFPSNFLLDMNGVVIKKDISLSDLEEFLKESL